MEELIVKKDGDSAEVELPNGCTLCGGALSVRFSANGAYSVCVSCRWIARPSVAFRDGAINVVFGPTAIA
jgi:hypothetical protein